MICASINSIRKNPVGESRTGPEIEPLKRERGLKRGSGQARNLLGLRAPERIFHDELNFIAFEKIFNSVAGNRRIVNENFLTFSTDIPVPLRAIKPADDAGGAFRHDKSSGNRWANSITRLEIRQRSLSGLYPRAIISPSLRAISSAGQSAAFTSRRSQVRSLYCPLEPHDLVWGSLCLKTPLQALPRERRKENA